MIYFLCRIVLFTSLSSTCQIPNRSASHRVPRVVVQRGALFGGHAMNRSSLLLCLAVLVVTIAFSTDAAAATRYVGQNETCKTIQSGIDAASNGDVVIVRDGTYAGAGNRDIDFKGKAIHLKSENGPERCIIDARGSESEPHRGFAFQNYEGPDSILDGFAITGGFAVSDRGGGWNILRRQFCTDRNEQHNSCQRWVGRWRRHPLPLLTSDHLQHHYRQ